MNDKCAGGTGAVIDKINAKLRIPSEQLCEMGYKGVKLHPVAGKCGVFAETDINGLQKMGVPPDELMASLFEAIVMQNLSVLTRGNTLLPVVLLLGGPNCYIKGMRDCWKTNIPKIWEERNTPLPEGVPPEDLIKTPDNAQYFAAIGSVEFGKTRRRRRRPVYRLRKAGVVRQRRPRGGKGQARRHRRTGQGRRRPGGFQEEVPHQEIHRRSPSSRAKWWKASSASMADRPPPRRCCFRRTTSAASWPRPISFPRATRSKTPSRCCRSSIAQIRDQGAELKILGVGTTGYAKDILKDVIGADAALVETVAHTEAGLHFYDDVDVICDVGGQDIKIIILKNGRVKDFKLNTQCSAGNGYFLQSTAQGFNVPVEQYADTAFGAKGFPSFGYGCAVFMQSDIVDFQRQGWKPEEIMAGLCNVLPKNIWLYVSQIPNLSAIGTRFLLQGGTQYNLAAVKAQVDFIESRFKGKDVQADVIVHEHCGEAGAIGAALEAGRLWDNGRAVHVHRPGRLRATSSTRPRATKPRAATSARTSACARSSTSRPTSSTSDYKPPVKTKVPLEAGAQRLIIATCEKGTVENIEDMRRSRATSTRSRRPIRTSWRWPPRACSACRTCRWWPTRCRSSRSPPRRRSAPS